MCRSVHTGKAGGSYWVCFATVGTVLQSSLLLCTALHCFARFCTILHWVCFATVPIFLGLCHQRLVCTSCSTQTTLLGNLQKYIWTNLKFPFLYSGSKVRFWLLIVKKFYFQWNCFVFGKTPNKVIPQRHFGAVVMCGSFLTLTLSKYKLDLNDSKMSLLIDMCTNCWTSM